MIYKSIQFEETKFKLVLIELFYKMIILFLPYLIVISLVMLSMIHLPSLKFRLVNL